MMGYLFLGLALTLNASANILLKIGSANLPKKFDLMAIIFNIPLVTGLFLFGLNIVFYSLALAKINLSIAYSVMTVGGIVIITLVSCFYLNETINVKQIIGIFLLLLGLFFVFQKV